MNALHLTQEQVALYIERSVEAMQNLLPTVALPWNGLLVPLEAIPPYARVSEEEG
ncbi:MAG: hypothetical protein OJF50_000950 [Nitrospira sp.]|jgi:hypothetical protein|nr:hypothetical protein [Nitrospira sp.]